MMPVKLRLPDSQNPSEHGPPVEFTGHVWYEVAVFTYLVEKE